MPPREAGVAPALAGPAAAVAHPGSYQHDGAWSVYWIADWPRHQVPATALAPLLAESTHRRAVSLHVEPLGPREAEREVMRERTEWLSRAGVSDGATAGTVQAIDCQGIH